MNRTLLALVCLGLASGCTVMVNSKARSLQETPFATQAMKGSVTEATTCVGRYWQKFASQGKFWEVTTGAYEVSVESNNGGQALVGPIIQFEDRSGTTFGLAYVHPVFKSDDPRRTVTLKAFEACKVFGPAAANPPTVPAGKGRTDAGSAVSGGASKSEGGATASANVSTQFDRFKEQTDVSLRPATVKLDGTVQLFAFASIEKGGKFSGAMLTLSSYNREWEYLKCHSAYWLADGVPIEMPAATHEGNVKTGGVVEQAIINGVSIGSLTVLADAQQIEFKLCNNAQVVDAATHDDLRVFVSKIRELSK